MQKSGYSALALCACLPILLAACARGPGASASSAAGSRVSASSGQAAAASGKAASAAHNAAASARSGGASGTGTGAGAGTGTDINTGNGTGGSSSEAAAAPVVKVSPVPAFQLTFPYDNSKRPINEILGSTHTGGLYHLTNEPFLYEGVETLLNDWGTRAVKLWFTYQYTNVYAFNSTWPAVSSLTELAKTEYYRNVFAMPFKTIDLEMQEFCLPDIKSGMAFTQSEKDAISNEDYNLARYLLETYKGTNRIFILQNWEGDNFIGRNASATTVQNMVDLLNLRQDAVEKARNEIGMNGCYLFYAAEINKISSDWSGEKLIDSALARTHCDLYSYSDWETGSRADQLKTNLDTLAAKTPDSKYFGSKNIMLGEFGAAQNVWGGDAMQKMIVKTQVEAALDWGVQFAFYWQLYCNESASGWSGAGMPGNDDVQGYWLIRPDGTKASVWAYFQSLFQKGTWK